MVVNILAKGTGWKEIEDVKDDGSITYGVNDAFLRTDNVDVSFHMHDLEDFLNSPRNASSTRLVINHANENPDKRIISVKPFEQIPHLEVYPLEEIVDYFGVCYFTNTVDYMIAYALWRGATRLRYFGVNMSVRLEYIEQKPGVEFWTGIAMGRGIPVELQHEHTSILKTKDGNLYGYLTPQFVPEIK